jgi:hypothetical protein
VAVSSSAPSRLSVQSVQQLDNDELLEQFRIVSGDIQRRVEIYLEQDSAAALVDGMRFVGRAHQIGSGLMHAPPHCLFLARDFVANRFAECTDA